MKKRTGFVKGVSTSLAERNASYKGLFDSMYDVDVAMHDVQAMLENNARLDRERAEISRLQRQLELHPEGTTEYQAATQRLEEIFRNAAEIRRRKESPFRKGVRNALLKLKYEVLHVAYMLFVYLLVIVFNVVALAGFIYFLPAITDWLF